MFRRSKSDSAYRMYCRFVSIGSPNQLEPDFRHIRNGDNLAPKFAAGENDRTCSECSQPKRSSHIETVPGQNRIPILLTVLFAVCCTAVVAGCRSEKTSKSNSPSVRDVDRGSVRPAKTHLPRAPISDAERIGGRPFDFFPHDYSGQWVVDNDGDSVFVYTFEPDGEQLVEVKADYVTICSADGAVFSLDPFEPNSGFGATCFGLTDANLAVSIYLGAEIIMNLDGQTYTAQLQGEGDQLNKD